MSQKSRVGHNILWLGLSPLLRALIGIPVAGFVAHALGLAGYGEFNFALSFVVLFGVVANPGVNEALVRTVARRPGDVSRVWSSVVVLKVGLFALYVCVAVAAALLLGYGTSLVFLIAVMAAYQGLFSLENSARALFAGNQEMKPIAGYESIRAAFEISLTVVVLLLGVKVFGLAVSRVVLGLMGVGAYMVLIRRRFHLTLTEPSASVAGGLITSGMGFAAIALVGSINSRAGFLVLEHARGIEAVAIFSAAMAPVERLALFLPAIEGALFPFFSSIKVQDEGRFAAAVARVFRYQVLIAVGLGLSVSLLGPWVLRLVFPAEFAGAWPVLEVLGIAVALRAFNGLLTTTVLAQGLDRHIAWISVARCGTMLAAATALAAPMGAVGLAWATGLSEGVAAITLLAVLRRRGSLRVLRPASLVVPALLGAAIFVGFHLVPTGRESPMMPLLFATAYPLLLVGSRMVSREDLTYLLGLVVKERHA
jgi:O-antigen/teichoic acid export membrane protein